MAMMTKRERVLAALNGNEFDRPPITFWHHFRPHGSARALAEATLDFFGRFDLDIFKVMPDLPYPVPHNSITSADQWHLLTPLALDAGNFGRQVETVRRVRAAVGPDVPVISTLFSPLTEAVSFAGIEHVRTHIQTDPATLHGALALIADNLARLGRALLDAGADGIFLSVQGTGDGLFTPSQFAEFGRPYDMMLLSAWREGWLNVLHAHAEHDLLFDELLQYPVAVWSWSDRYTGVSLRHMRSLLPYMTLMGGLHERGAITTGPVEAIATEIHDALEQVDHARLILAPGCSVPDDCPEEWLRATRAAVDPD